MEKDGCPSLEVLDMNATGVDVGALASNHIAACPVCREKVAVIQDDALAAKEMRVAAESNIPGALRRRLLAICRHAMIDASKDLSS